MQHDTHDELFMSDMLEAAVRHNLRTSEASIRIYADNDIIPHRKDRSGRRVFTSDSITALITHLEKRGRKMQAHAE